MKIEEEESSKGFLISQSVGYRPENSPLQGDINMAWFQTDDYDTRLSAYERNILYAFYIPTFYGKGLRLAATLRWNILSRLAFYAKFGLSHYTDRDEVGTDLEAINGSTRMDVNALLRWKF